MTFQKRRRKLTDTHVQGALVRRVLLHWFILFTVTAVATTAISAFQSDPGLPLAARPQGELGRLGVLCGVMLLLLPAFVLDTLRFSNRFVGPISRVRNCLRTMATTGRCDRIKFRGDDFWRSMADELNSVAERLENGAPTSVKADQQTSIASTESAAAESVSPSAAATLVG